MTDHIADASKMVPLRIQRRRTRGWKLPPNTVCVCRPGKFGNPWTITKARYAGFIGTDLEIQAMCVNSFRNGLAQNLPATDRIMENLPALVGKNLACWCKVCPAHVAGKPFTVQCDACEPCHADVLGMAANNYQGRT